MTATVTLNRRRPPKFKGPIRRTPARVAGFLGLGVLAVVVVIAGSALLYISRSAYQAGHQTSPVDTVDGFLDAALHDRQMSTMDKYLCGATARRQAGALLTQINTVEANDGSVRFLWTATHVVSRSGTDSATVAATVTATVSSGSGAVASSPRTWKFNTADRGGWKICSFTTT